MSANSSEPGQPSRDDLARMDIIVVSAIDREEVLKRGLPSDITLFGKPIPFHEIKGFLLGPLAARQRTTA